MRIAIVAAGFAPGEADRMRRAMATFRRVGTIGTFQKKMVEGMVARFKAELGAETKVIGTGGLAPLIARGTTVLDEIAPWLTLDGLRILYELNEE